MGPCFSSPRDGGKKKKLVVLGSVLGVQFASRSSTRHRACDIINGSVFFHRLTRAGIRWGSSVVVNWNVTLHYPLAMFESKGAI